MYLVCMYKYDLALNNQEGLICHKSNLTDSYISTINVRGAYDKFPDFFRMRI